MRAKPKSLGDLMWKGNSQTNLNMHLTRGEFDAY